MKIFLFLIAPFIMFSQKSIDVQKIVDKSIKVHGGKNYIKKGFQFDFRNKTYTAKIDKKGYRYTRSWQEEGSKIEDILTQEGYSRSINSLIVEIDPQKARAYSNSTNSVIYFSLLPYFLNDAAVHKSYIGVTEIKGQKYHKVQVTFDENGGGQDHEDVYIYWINQKTFMVDYLAYSFEVNGGGVRFRSAYNRRSTGGVIFQDYVNYQHEKTTPVADLDQYFIAGQLKELSKIELINISTF